MKKPQPQPQSSKSPEQIRRGLFEVLSMPLEDRSHYNKKHIRRSFQKIMDNKH